MVKVMGHANAVGPTLIEGIFLVLLKLLMVIHARLYSYATNYFWFSVNRCGFFELIQASHMQTGCIE